MSYERRIAEAKSIGDMFSIVKQMVGEFLKVEQAGLLVGISDLGMRGNSFVGAFYSPDANTIIINKRPLAKMLRQNPANLNNYLFHVMLHEYVHSLGLYNEEQTRLLVEEMTTRFFGENHPISKMTWNIGKYLDSAETELPQGVSIEFVEGIDRENTDYIQ